MKVKVTLPSGLRSASMEAIKEATEALMGFAQQRATQLAQQRLRGSSSSAYARGLTTPASLHFPRHGVGVLELVGAFPQALERGTGPFDIKRMLRGRKYVDVPLRHGTPGTTVLRPMPKQVYDAMAANIAMARGAAKVRGPRTFPSMPANITAKFGSMTRINSGAGSQYLTFRRISQKSPSSSWIHPGFKPVSIFPVVARDVRKLAPRLVRDFLKRRLNAGSP